MLYIDALRPFFLGVLNRVFLKIDFRLQNNCVYYLVALEHI